MTDNEKEQLCGNGYKLNGFCANVAGWRNEYATISPCTGGFYRTTWEVVKKVADSEDKDFARHNLWKTSLAWLGVGCTKESMFCKRIK